MNIYNRLMLSFCRATADASKKLKNGDGAPTASPSASSKGKERAATVEDLPADGEDDGVERLDYTPQHEESSSYDFAPNGDADYFQEEDEDGRFFGGGLTGEQKEIMDILEQGDGTGQDEEPQALDLAGVRKQLLGLERAINKNREMRTRFSDDPTKCVSRPVAE